MYTSETILPVELGDALRNAGYFPLSQLVNEVHARGARRFDYYSPRFVTDHLLKFSQEATPLIDDQVKFKSFLEERKKLVATIFQVRYFASNPDHETHAAGDKHSTKCERWYDNKRNDRREELQGARSVRKSAYVCFFAI
jgi:hypothetical protein